MERITDRASGGDVGCYGVLETAALGVGVTPSVDVQVNEDTRRGDARKGSHAREQLSHPASSCSRAWVSSRRTTIT